MRSEARSVIASIRRRLPALQHDLLHAVTVSAQAARAAGRTALETEMKVSVARRAADAAVDDAVAMTASASLAGAWGAAALAAITAATLPKDVPRAIASVPADLDARVRRTAVTETARAFNDERNELLVILGGGAAVPNHLARDRPQPGLFKIWSAVLDGVTCPRCWAIDGTTLDAHKPFPSGPPPLHPHCRCIIEHVIVAKPERLEDIAIDYDLFKQELSDVIREQRAESARQALRFTTESLGAKRSPITLTKRFHDEPYATRR